MSKLQSVRIQRFKRIADAPFNLAEINVLVGANNSGKSSVIQGVHFGIGVLQTIKLTGARRDATSLNPTQLIYSPSESVYSLGLGGKLVEDQSHAIEVTYTLSSGESCSVQIRKGRNRNILTTVTSPDVADGLASLENPFSIFSPGLAGIAKNEAYVSDGVLLRTLARGDANLVLRNILLRISNKPEWDAFLQDLHKVFPTIEIHVRYEEKTAEHIDVQVKTNGEWVPIELAGTGVLQATQILSYIHTFAPTIVVLDEPDSHLHPNNQRLLCALLRQIAEERKTQVLLTTHSRHVVDALGSSANFLWVRNSTVEHATRDDEIGILLDIGALDVKERVGTQGTKIVVLTEDEQTRGLEAILEASGFDINATVILPYFGATTIKNLRPLVRMIRSSNSKAIIVLHRDRDYLEESEASDWEQQVRSLRVESFLTDGTDIESFFVNPLHLAELNSQADAEIFQQIVSKVATDTHAVLIERFVNGRVEIARRNGTYGNLNLGQLAAKAPGEIDQRPDRFRHGKTMLVGIVQEFRARYSQNLQYVRPTKYIKNDSLCTVAHKAFKTASRD